MGSLGVSEIAFIFVLALLIFGPKKLPEIGRTLGRGVAEFRKATTELKRSINTELALEEQPVPPVLRPRRLEDSPAEAQRETVLPGEVPATPADTEPWTAPARALDPDDPR
ncbi:MAG TPA: twin-arginine translocase TatA/TatE family subunit [Thermoanaerobaculia bacterium]|nr:twin-arginine translocase TatA/TatE family subunit [Thermoanaerobaculia bacterium]